MELESRQAITFSTIHIFQLQHSHLSSVFIAFLLAFIVYKTSFGLRLRICGEMPEALKAAGIKKWGSFSFGQASYVALCGLAGAQLSLYNVRMFSCDMTGIFPLPWPP